MHEGLASEIMVFQPSPIFCLKDSDIVIFWCRCSVGNHLPPPVNLCTVV